MTGRLIPLTILTLVLPLAPLVPYSAQAQTKNEASSPTAAGSGRQVIRDKLERIRLDTVRYDGLPLGEVVVNLRDEAKKRDPEKKGINFLINPRPDRSEAPAAPSPVVVADGTPAPPQEQVDVNSVCVKINPPLTDVRLVDVLDAVVKVADHPIKYVVEDYGVVISLRGSEPARGEVSSFVFPGGTPHDFLNAVQQQYKVDWLSVANIPNEMREVRIPKLRINQDSLVPILQRPGGDGGPLGALVSLYNQLGEQKPELGCLVVKGDLARPSVVMFVPDKTALDRQPKVKVKAFSIYGISDTERANLREEIDQVRMQAINYSLNQPGTSGGRALDGMVAVHGATSLLVATGPESFVDMVELIVTAFLAKEAERRPLGKPAVSNALPAAPGR